MRQRACCTSFSTACSRERRRGASVESPIGATCGFPLIAVGVRPDAEARRRGDTRSVASATHPRPTGTSLDEATVADTMTNGLISCAPETPLRNVARLMARYSVHAIFVFDFGREDDETVELWGLVSD